MTHIYIYVSKASPWFVFGWSQQSSCWNDAFGLSQISYMYVYNYMYIIYMHYLQYVCINIYNYTF